VRSPNEQEDFLNPGRFDENADASLSWRFLFAFYGLLALTGTKIRSGDPTIGDFTYLSDRDVLIWREGKLSRISSEEYDLAAPKEVLLVGRPSRG
jgi:hypothetical protein